MVLHKILSTRAGVAFYYLYLEHKTSICKFVAHSKPLFELCLICMQVWCLEGFGVTLHKLMEV